MTRAQAIKQALQNLRVLDAISNPSAEDAATVGDRLDQEHARLDERGLVWWSTDDIPAGVAGPFCRLVAAACADAFNKSYDPGNAEKQIAAIKAAAEWGEPVRTAYF